MSHTQPTNLHMTKFILPTHLFYSQILHGNMFLKQNHKILVFEDSLSSFLNVFTICPHAKYILLERYTLNELINNNFIKFMMLYQRKL